VAAQAEQQLCTGVSTVSPPQGTLQPCRRFQFMPYYPAQHAAHARTLVEHERPQSITSHAQYLLFVATYAEQQLCPGVSTVSPPQGTLQPCRRFQFMPYYPAQHAARARTLVEHERPQSITSHAQHLLFVAAQAEQQLCPGVSTVSPPQGTLQPCHHFQFMPYYPAQHVAPARTLVEHERPQSFTSHAGAISSSSSKSSVISIIVIIII
jgi:hypothetical protein